MIDTPTSPYDILKESFLGAIVSQRFGVDMHDWFRTGMRIAILFLMVFLASCSVTLAKLAKPGDRVCIVFTDITRSSPDHLLVPALLKELENAGVRDEDITLLCGIGMHRPSTGEEKATKLSADVVSRYRVIDNEPQNPSALVDLGLTPGGVPVHLHRAVVETDFLIATGIVEPHQYAGYSGGRKTVAVGAAGEALIAHTHGPAFVDHPGTRLGKIEANPFHEAVTEAARRANLRFILYLVCRIILH